MAGVHTQQSTKSGSGRFGTLTIAVADDVTSEDDDDVGARVLGHQ